MPWYLWLVALVLVGYGAWLAKRRPAPRGPQRFTGGGSPLPEDDPRKGPPNAA